MKPALRVAFAGTPEFAAIALQQLLQAGFQVPLVLTQPDRPAGRGMKLQASPVKQLALRHGIPVLQPMGLKLDGKYPTEAAAAQAQLLAADIDVMVVAAYGLILPLWTLALPRWGCLNIHASLLPRWRGAAPIHRAIEAGDAETGITIMQMDQGLDTGDMLAKQAIPILSTDTTASLHDRLAVLGGEMLLTVLQQRMQGALVQTPQPTEGITYAHKIEKSEASIDWTLGAETLARQVRAFNPFPGAVTHHAGDALKVWAAHPKTNCSCHDVEVPVGTVLCLKDAGIEVQTQDGVLVLTELQRAGGKRLSAADFLRGTHWAVGEKLGI